MFINFSLHKPFTECKSRYVVRRTMASSSCPGCGAPFQTIDPHSPGYLPPVIEVSASDDIQSKIQSIQAKTDPLSPSELKFLLRYAKSPSTGSKASLVCQRCHSLKSQHKENANVPFKTNMDQFQQLKTSDRGWVVLVLDAMDLPGTMIPNLASYIGSNKKVILAINKIDLLPSDIGRQWIHYWINNHLPTHKLFPHATVFLSAKTGDGIFDLVSSLQSAHQNNEHVYFVGCTNVGKSALLNTLSQLSGGASRILPTVSSAAGTTQQPIELPFSEFHSLMQSVIDTDNDRNLSRKVAHSTSKIIDMAGVMNPFQLSNLLTASELKLSTPRGPLVKREEVIHFGKTAYIAGLIRVDCLESQGECQAQFYGAKSIPFGVMETAKYQNMIHKLPGVPGASTLPASSESYRHVFSPPLGRTRTASFVSLMKPACTLSLSPQRRFAFFVLSGLGWLILKTTPSISRAATSTGNALGVFQVSSPNGQGVFSTSLSLHFKMMRGPG